jgi:glycosyltransferase involved in cell wall biosynthesis
MKPIISVIVPAYNEEKCLPKCLEALKKQTFQKPFEVIVVDNCSTDKTTEIAGAFNVRIVSENRKGQVFAKNSGVHAAQAPIVAIL